MHVIGPEQGLTQPGMTVVCGDSHTSTHGAFGALAFGIGTSEVEHVLATQTLPQTRPQWMAVTIDGELPAGSTAKDVILGVIGRIGTGGGIGSVIEYRGSVVPLALDGGADDRVQHVDRGGRQRRTHRSRRHDVRLPRGPRARAARARLGSKRSTTGAHCPPTRVRRSRRTSSSTRRRSVPHVSWGTNPSQVIGIDGSVPDPDSFLDAGDRETAARALAYMGLEAGTPMRSIPVDTVFIGSCTNSRIEDLRAAAAVAAGRTVTVKRAMVVPGSVAVKRQAEQEGLDKVFRAAGFDWREAGCSMCLAMNPDKLAPQERCASTSNRNFEGRQGRGGRTHLVSPAIAAATAIAGTFATPEDLSMKAVRAITGTAVPLDRSDVDTDQIIPSDWLKKVERTGFGKGLFSEWRDDRSFVLNDERFAGLGQHDNPADHRLRHHAERLGGREPHQVAPPPSVRPEPPGRDEDRPAMMTSGKFSSRLLNSIQVLTSVCPAFLLATMSAALHCGQFGAAQPGRAEPHRGAGRHDRRVGDDAGQREPPHRGPRRRQHGPGPGRHAGPQMGGSGGDAPRGTGCGHALMVERPGGVPGGIPRG